MAVSKLWPVTVRLATVLDYASNPEKTTKSKSKYSDADYQALRDVVNYVKNGEKTEQASKPITAILALRKPTSHRSLPSISEWSSQIPFGARNIRCW